MFFRLLLTAILLSAELFSQNLDSLQNQIELADRLLVEKKKAVENEKSNFPLFIITGEIIDRESNSIGIWGSAYPENDDFSSTGTVEENNIIVFNPDKEKIIYNGYFGGKHYYLFKGFTKNAFNADVPVRYYGDLPTDTKNKIDLLESEIISLEIKIESLTDNHNSIKTDLLIVEASEYLHRQNYVESISILKQVKNITDARKHTEINQLLFENYIESAKSDSGNKNYINSLSSINTALQLSDLSNEQKAYLNDFHFQLCKTIADNSFNNQDFSEAVNYYSQSLTYNQNNIDLIQDRYSKAYYYLGNDELANGNIEGAKKNYNNSVKINSIILPQIKSELEKLKRPSLLLGISSIIPGLGQLIQGDAKNAFVHFGVFGGSLVGGLVLKNTADNEYNDYKNATTENDAVRLYDSANQKLNISYALYGLGGIVIIYSVIDSFIRSENYNKKYEINFEGHSQSSQNNDDFSIAVKLFF